MSNSTTTRKPRRLRRLVGMLTVAAVLATWWLLLRPATLGGPLTMVTVTGTSMEPGMYTGDLAVIRKTGSYEPGEVIAYRVPHADGTHGAVVIHRIIGGDATTGFVMRGDNNDFRDPWQPRPRDIAGELVVHVPDAGRFVSTLQEPVTAGALCAALVAFLIMAGAGDHRRDGRVDTTEREEHSVGGTS